MGRLMQYDTPIGGTVGNANEVAYDKTETGAVDANNVQDAVTRLNASLTELDSNLTATVDAQDVDFEFLYDSQSQNYGYRNASGNFQSFGGGALSTRCKIKSMVYIQSSSSSAATANAVIFNDDSSYYNISAATAADAGTFVSTNSDIVNMSGSGSATAITYKKDGYYAVTDNAGSVGLRLPALHNNGDTQKFDARWGVAIVYVGVELPS